MITNSDITAHQTLLSRLLFEFSHLDAIGGGLRPQATFSDARHL